MATSPAMPPESPSRSVSSAPLVGLVRGAFEHADQRATLLGVAGCLGMLGLIFWPNLRHFVYIWSTDENYSHGFLVPLISLYFANEAARRGPTPIRSGVGLGTVLLALAMVGKWATVLIPVGFVADVALLLGLAGICSLLFGAEALKRYGFALAFLIFMVPLPVALYAKLASPLQLMVSQIASKLLNGSGIPVLCEGNSMTLPGDVRMFVAEACSGMRQLTGFFALTTAVAYLTSRAAWYRAVVVAASIPIAMTANVIRVTVTGIIMYHDPRLALGAFHTAEGLVMMGFGLSLLGGLCWTLNRLAPPSTGSAGASGPLTERESQREQGGPR